MITRKKFELKGLVGHLDEAVNASKIEIGPEKTKVLTCNLDDSKFNIGVNDRLDTVKNFKYLGSIIFDDGSEHEILYRIAQTNATLRLAMLNV